MKSYMELAYDTIAKKKKDDGRMNPSSTLPEYAAIRPRVPASDRSRPSE